MQQVATVFGGSGFIGRRVVQRLARAGYAVRVAVRDATGAQRLWTQGHLGQVASLAVPITDEAAVARALQGAAVAVNLVGILHARRAGEFERVQAEGAGRVARLARAAGVRRLVHVSALGADPASASLYARSKAEGEALVRAGFPDATILRPSVVFGPGDAFFTRFAGLAARIPCIMPVVAGGARFQPVHVDDVADAVMAAIARPEAAGATYELGGPRVMTMREVLALVLQATGRRRRLVAVPPAVIALQARFAEYLPNPPITRDQLILLRRDSVVTEAAPGLAALGIAPKAVEAVVPQFLARFRVGGVPRPRE
ncbi:MAG TPA: complex I NDUFA9 subunit family protein [Roseomonas sp.]|jgi:NADH dehydrogenase